MRICPDYIGPYCGMFIECPKWLQGNGEIPKVDPKTCDDCDCYGSCTDCKRPEQEGMARQICRNNHRICDCAM